LADLKKLEDQISQLKRDIDEEKRKGEAQVQAREDWWKAETARVTEEAQQQVQKVLSDNEDSRKETQQQVLDITANVEEQRKDYEARIDQLALSLQQMENTLLEKDTLLAA